MFSDNRGPTLPWTHPSDEFNKGWSGDREPASSVCVVMGEECGDEAWQDIYKDVPCASGRPHCAANILSQNCSF